MNWNRIEIYQVNLSMSRIKIERKHVRVSLAIWQSQAILVLDVNVFALIQHSASLDDVGMNVCGTFR